MAFELHPRRQRDCMVGLDCLPADLTLSRMVPVDSLGAVMLHWTVHVHRLLPVLQRRHLRVPVGPRKTVFAARLALVHALRLWVVLVVNCLKLWDVVAPNACGLSLAFPELLEDRVVVAVRVVPHVDEVLRIKHCVTILH